MIRFDLPLEELRGYRPAIAEPTDFDDFWRETIDRTSQMAAPSTYIPADVGLSLVDVFDVTFTGWAGQPIKAWLILPRGIAGRLPVVIEFAGYGGGRGLPYAWLTWPAAGFAGFVMDIRGQGAAWMPGETGDSQPADEAGPEHPGMMTRGIRHHDTYYYRRLFADAVRAVESIRTHPRIDPARVVVSGRSQGGGIALALAGLVPDLRAALIDVPFLCHFPRALEITDADPYGELQRYLSVQRDHETQVFETLSYFDGCNFAPRARTPSLWSVGLLDTVCPPSTVFAAYNRYGGDKSINVWAHNGHDACSLHQERERLDFVLGLGLRD